MKKLIDSIKYCKSEVSFWKFLGVLVLMDIMVLAYNISVSNYSAAVAFFVIFGYAMCALAEGMYDERDMAEIAIKVTKKAMEADVEIEETDENHEQEGVQ